MHIKFDFILNKHHKHTRDEIFELDEMRRDICLFSRNDNKLKIKIRYRDWLYCDYRLDITDYKFFFTLKNNPTDSDTNAVYKNDVADMTEAVDGEAEMIISESSGEDFEGNYLYSLKMKTKEGEIRTLCYGICSFIKELSSRQ